ncbi:MAG: hypothetical protein LBD55_02470 [Treponema sp.]|jgi:hypothetical protein|nr:hypothetical protein [Treponema sp.]
MAFKKSQFGTFPVILGMCAALLLAGACSGLLPEDGSSNGTNSGLVEVTIPIPNVSTARTPYTTIQMANPKEFVTYYEVFFFQLDANEPSDRAKGKIIASGSAVVGDEVIKVSVPPNTGSQDYEVLVLAGTHANQNPINGEKVLLGSGYKHGVEVIRGQRNVVTVTMYELDVGLEVWGIKKGTSPLPEGHTNTPVAIQNSYDNGFQFVELEKQTVGTGMGLPINNVWANPSSNYTIPMHYLKVGIALGNLDPLLLASAGNNNSVTASIFEPEPRIRIEPLSYRTFTMNPIIFDTKGDAIPAIDPDNGAWPSSSGVTPRVTDWDNTTLVGTSKTDIALSYAQPAAVYGDPIKINVPTQDAAGRFYFNYKYYPFGRPDAGSYWNIRNRIIWSENGYFGGAVVFLFGRAGSEWVEVMPEYIPDVFIPVTNIIAPTTAQVGVSLSVEANVQPAYATNRTISWALVSNGSGGGTVPDGDVTFGLGTVTISSAGTIVVKATITDGIALGMNYEQIFTITVTPP